MDTSLLNHVAQWLYQSDHAIAEAMMYADETLNNAHHFEANPYMDELIRVGIAKRDEYHNYFMPLHIKQQIPILPKEYENRPYEYFADELTKSIERERMSKWWESENARIMFENYPLTDRRSKSGLYWSIVAAVSAAIAVIISLLK